MTGDQDAALALSEFRREVGVSLAELRGDVRLVLQRGEQSERRLDDLARQVAKLDERVDLVERDQVTKPQLDERSRRTIAILALIVTIAAALASTAATVIIAIVN
ncbi:hypothetical protein [Actinomadura rubrisoli]|uniref:Uncharacterized protein n=1 Tax=Actinomadura rubrisoli TaxID=2530368 RepID=A0A4R5BY34_9ACTN|nr:hypothetical protein [Actinomadura rubrisoli]TDD90766.1 hypothetical protein E1298_12760 [Actinomadura rubrisoli]